MTRSRAVLSRRVAVTAALIGLLSSGVAHGADDYRTGSQSDPESDGSIVFADYGGDPARLVDIRSVRVGYDAGVGSLEVHFDGDLNGVGHSSLEVQVSVSAPNSAGQCDGRFRPGDFTFAGRESARAYSPNPSRAELSDHSGVLIAEGQYEDEDQTGSGPRMTIRSAALLSRDLRCVSRVHATKTMSGLIGASRDDVRDFRIGGDLIVAPPANLRLSGTKLEWDRVGRTNAYVVATSNLPEGVPGRTTVYTTVSGTTYTPPPSPGSTRYYGVRADLPGSAWAKEVAVSYPAGPLVGGLQVGGSAPAQNPSGAAPTQSGGVNQGVVVNNVNTISAPQTTTTVSLTLTASSARSAARKALAARYGRVFGRRAARGYRLACVPGGAGATCQVRWRYKRSRYRGAIFITRTQEGDRWRTDIRRTTVRAA